MDDARGTMVVEEQGAPEVEVALGTDPDFGPGLDVLRLAADAGLTSVVPRMRFDVTGRSSRVMEVVEGVPASSCTLDGVLDPIVAAALGEAVGAWHHATAGAVGRVRPAAVALPAIQLVRDPLLQAALAAARSAWRAAAVVHGDCRVGNAALRDAPWCGHPAVVLTGWARSGAGDPAWDLGCLLADLLGRRETAGPTAATLVEPSVAACVVAYGRAAGPTADADLARRVVLCAVARAAACGLDAGGRAALAPARAIAADAARWTEHVARWLR
jgi:aminoglycoside phosphotransferase (APT) family kinase protein